MNKAVEQCRRKDSSPSAEKSKEKRTKLNDYTPKQRAEIDSYIAENGPIRAAKVKTLLPLAEYKINDNRECGPVWLHLVATDGEETGACNHTVPHGLV